MQAQPKYTNSTPWIIWGLAALFYFYEFFLQVSPNVMANDLMSAFHIGGKKLGNLSAIYFIAYAAMQIPVGLLLDRFGPRKLLTFAALLCTIGNFLFAISFHLWQAQIARLFIGLGSSFAVVSCLKLAANWFPIRRFALLTGLTVTTGMLGAVAGEAPMALLVDLINWRNTMFVLSVFGALFSFFMWRIIRDHPQHNHQNTKVSSHEKYLGYSHLIDALKTIFKSKQNWIVAIYGGLMFAPTSAFGALWGVNFLIARYGASRALAAATISLLFIGWACGSPLFGAFSDKIGKRCPPMWVGSIGALIAVLIILYVKIPLFLMGFLLFSFGFFSSGFLAAFSVIRENNSGHANATALGFMNTLNMVGGAVLQPLIGWLLDMNWQHTMRGGARIFSVHNYQIALVSLPLCIGCSIFILWFIKDTYCRLREKPL